MIQQEGTPACRLRDELRKLKSNGKITYSQIADRLAGMNLPDWLQSQIVNMVDYRKYDRVTDPVEQAMEAAVHRKILEKILTT